MKYIADTGAVRRKPRYLTVLAVIICGIALNVFGSNIASRFELTLFLDSIGTVIVAMLSGALPGIVVGLITNIYKSFDDPASLYYGTLNVLIAVCASGFARHGWTRKILGNILLILSLSVIGGVLGSILTWFLYGFAEEGISVGFARELYDKGTLSGFQAQLIADFLIDLSDKTITVILALLIVRPLPAKLKKRLYFAGWCQTPLPSEVLKLFRSRKCRELSLRGKLLLVITISLTVVAATSIGIGTWLYRSINIQRHEDIATGAARMASRNIDPAMVDDYLQHGETARSYLKTERLLYDLRDSTEDLKYVYVYKIEEDGCHVVFDLDTDDEPGADPGDIQPFDESFSKYLPALMRGDEIDPIITDDSFGYLMTVYAPVRDAAGNTVCYVGVDVQMADIRSETHEFLAKQISLFLGFFILLMEAGLWLIEYHVILPVNSMAYSADAFAYNNEEAIEDNVGRIKKLRIRTGDEIENLYRAFSKTTEDTVQYMNDIRSKNETITKMQNGLIIVLADIVESRDKSTGDHIRKTATYVDIILHKMREKGLYPDILTDEYISDVVHSAPLHDIGKIKVSDTVLNKPGRLNDEEYEQMKYHTIAGAEIIEQAMENVSVTQGYLLEARNLALYHHEKWDGSGYPKGLKGEEIPLSARVMAVADVFDALSSKRVYKPSMTLEDAMKIIVDGSGKHFDPEVVAAFEDSVDEVRACLNGFTEAEKVYTDVL